MMFLRYALCHLSVIPEPYSLHEASIEYQASCIEHRVSSIEYQASIIEYREIGIQPIALNASCSAIETNADLTRIDNNRYITFPI